jgi:exonuclease III
MNRYDLSAVTLRIMSHNTNRSSNALETLLNTAGKTADIVLVQEAKIKDIWYATTHPDFILLLPPHGMRKVNRTATCVHADGIVTLIKDHG